MNAAERQDGGAWADNYITVTQMAQELDKHRNTIGLWIRRRHIEAVRIGGHYRIPRSELERVKSNGLHLGRQAA